MDVVLIKYLLRHTLDIISSGLMEKRCIRNIPFKIFQICVFPKDFIEQPSVDWQAEKTLLQL
jgi:hypothetical protein